MRAVKDSLAAPLRAKWGKPEGPRPGKWHVPGNRLRSNRRVGRVKNICQWGGRVRTLRAVGIIPATPYRDSSLRPCSEPGSSQSKESVLACSGSEGDIAAERIVRQSIARVVRHATTHLLRRVCSRVADLLCVAGISGTEQQKARARTSL